MILKKGGYSAIKHFMARPNMEERRLYLNQKVETFTAICDRLSMWRGLVFVFLLVFLALVFWQRLWALPAAIALLGFVILVLIHRRQLRLRRYYERLRLIHEQYIARRKRHFDRLEDNGEMFFVDRDPISDDLDLFGDRSIFHLLSTARTHVGRKTLADLLRHSKDQPTNVEDLCERQRAIEAFANDLVLMENFQEKAIQKRRVYQNPDALIAYAEDMTDQSLPGIRMRWLYVITACLLILSGLLAWVHPVFLTVFLTVLLTHIIVMAVTYNAYKPHFISVQSYARSLRSYGELFKAIERTKIDDLYLTELQTYLTDETKKIKASASVKRLWTISLLAQARSQPILFFLLNSICLYDVHCMHALLRWKKDAGKHLRRYFDVLGIWEALMSLASMPYACETTCLPTVVLASKKGSKAYFAAKAAGHPLISPDHLVCNDLTLTQSIALVTGSNMSGKTTLLRTVGVNAVLAYAGARCCAQELTLTPMRVMSSMRVRDDISEGLSTFYAELLRIGQIIKASKDQQPLLFLIDEIFRGTNSKDRTEGARTVLHHLSKKWICGMMTTHDYELCSITKREKLPITYCHFSEYFDEDGICFDYMLRKGVSTTTNARYLMRLIGIDDQSENVTK